MADIFDVVADATRRELLHLLLDSRDAGRPRSGELSVGELVDRLGVTQPTVSKHLKVLREHGIVSVREDGQHRFYRLDPAPLEALEDWVVPFLGAGANRPASGRTPSGVAATVAAWPGAAAGRNVGRVVAERSHRARAAVEGAQVQVSRGIRRITGG